MVGLRLARELIPAGTPVLGLGFGQGLFPVAAAISSLHLPRYCSACFTPCIDSASLTPCQGCCHGAVVYCSSYCSSLDLDLHCNSGECVLLSVCGPSGESGDSRAGPVEVWRDAFSSCDVWRGPTSFRFLGGTCDLRAALRLLAHHEAQHDTSRFLASREKDDRCRLGGLMSNRSALLRSPSTEESLDVFAMHGTSSRPGEVLSPSGTPEIDEDYQELARELREAALLMCFARHVTAQSATAASGGPITRRDEILLAEEVICQVFTNGVQIQADKLEQPDSILAKSGSYLVTVDLGTAVYGPLFSWFNHSCRPNALYRFGFGDPRTYENSFPHEIEVMVVPDTDITDVVEAWGLESCQAPWSRRATSVSNQASQFEKRYGPRITVQSIANINESEEVCITYTDLLQPKCPRKLELWRKYRFDCKCERCTETPTTYADEVLQKIGLCYGPTEMSAIEESLLEETEQGIMEFMVSDNPWSCCHILEHALEQLAQGAFQDLISQEGLPMSSYECSVCKRSVNFCAAGVDNSCPEFGSVWTEAQHQMQNENHMTVHLMHRMCLDIYTALSSSYRVAAADSKHLAEEKHLSFRHMALGEEPEGQNFVSGICGATAGVSCSAASAGYTLLVASAVQHLFESGEHGLIAIAARFWLHTGEVFIRLISELDSHFCVKSPKTSTELRAESCWREGLTQLFGNLGNCGFFNPFLGERERSELRGVSDILHAKRNAIEVDHPCSTKATFDFSNSLMHILEYVWPLLRESSPFLSYIERPLYPNKICHQKSVSMLEMLESAEMGQQSRILFLLCSSCCLQYSKYLSEIWCGCADPVVTAAENLLHWIMKVLPSNLDIAEYNLTRL